MLSVEARTREIIQVLFDAVEARDTASVVRAFTPNAVFRHMPHEREDIETLFAPMLGLCERAEWVIRRELYASDFGLVERDDCYWVDGQEYRIECTAVFEVDHDRGQISEMREYMDLGLWRERLAPIMGLLTAPASG